MNKQYFLAGKLLKTMGFSLALIISITGCTGLLQPKPLQTHYYTLQNTPILAKSEPSNTSSQTLFSLSVSTPKAASGFTTRRMMYTLKPHQLEYFAYHEWVDTPANMLHTLLVGSIASSGQFKAVVPKQSLIKSELRLESELVQLIQNFHQTPSQTQFILRATLINNLNSKVIATREFKSQVDTITDDPVAGVEAANKAVNAVLDEVNQFIRQELASNAMVVN